MAKSLADLKVQDVVTFVQKARGVKMCYIVPEDTLKQAVKVMVENEVCALPVLENHGQGEKEKYFGMISITDVVQVTSELAGPKGEGFGETMAAVLERKVSELQEEYHLLPENNKAKVSDNLMDVVRNGFVRPNYFRMAVFDGEKATALLSQNDVVEFIAQSPDLLGVKATCPISKLGMASAKAASVKETDTVLNALALARAQGQREVGVLDAAGKLVGIINAGTLEGVADLSTLLLSISEFKAKHPIAEPVIVSSRATLSEVVAVVGPAARRVYVVDEQGMPEFFMPTEDVLRNIVNSGWEFNNVTVADVCKIAHHPIQVLTMNTEKTLGEAMKELAEHSVLTAPVLRGGKYVGMVDAFDILSELIACLEDRQRGTLKEDDHKAGGYQYSIGDKEVFTEVSGRILENLNYSSKDLLPGDMTLHNAIATVFLPNRYHRVSVTKDSPPTKESKVSDILSQRDIAKFLSQFPDILGDRGEKSIEELGFLSRRVHTVNYRDSMMKAFQIMYHSTSRAMPVVNGKGKLVSSISIGDLKGLNNFYHLRLMVCFAKSQVDNPEDYAPDQIPLPMPLYCTKDESLSSVLKNMSVHLNRSVYVVDDQMHPISEVTLTDIFKSLVKPGADQLFKSKH